MLPSQATTAQEAWQAIRAQPLPSADDLSRLPSHVQDLMFRPRVEVFNDQRAAAARDALQRLAPERSDYRGLNPSMADAEYQDSMAQFNADPYVAELRRIDSEATTQRSVLPSYLIESERTVDVRSLPEPEMRNVLAALGVDLPDDATPSQIDAAYELLASMPQSLAGAVINSGTQVTYTKPAVGINTPSFIPARAGANLVIEGEVSLTDPRVGVGFEQSQKLEMSVELRGELSVGAGSTVQRRIYGWATRIESLTRGSDDIKRMVESSPLLRNAVRGLPISFNAASYAGTRLSYEAVVTPDQGGRIADGELGAAPNPLEPLSMPAGTSVLIRGQNLVGSQFDVGYKLLRVGTQHAELEGQGFGVRRGEGDSVEIYAGPVSTVENELFVGLGKGSVSIGLAVDKSYELLNMDVATLDLSTDEGRAAYQQFIGSGQIPAWDPPGVMRAGAQDIYSAEHSSRLGVNAGALSVGFDGPASEYNVTETTWQDGSVEQTSSYWFNGVTSEVRFPRDANGQPVEAQATWQLVVADSNPALASYLYSAYNPLAEQHEFDGEQHVQYTFSSAQLMDLRDQARDYFSETIGEDYLRRLEQGDLVVGIPDRDADIAIATSPEEVFTALESWPDFVPEDLLVISLTTGEATPGQVAFRAADSD